jgi:hypothetical protein
VSERGHVTGAESAEGRARKREGQKVEGGREGGRARGREGEGKERGREGERDRCNH